MSNMLNPRHSRHLIALFLEAHDADALRVAAEDADRLEGRADDLALSRDDDDVAVYHVVGVDQEGVGDVAGLARDLGRLEPAAAAALDLIGAEVGALAEAVRHDGQYLITPLLFLVGLGDAHADDPVGLMQAYAVDAGGAAAHGTNVGFLESDGLALGRHELDMVAARSRLDPDQLVVALDLEGDETGTADVGESRQFHLLDQALLGREEQILAGNGLIQRQDGRDLLAADELEEIDDRRALGDARGLGRQRHPGPTLRRRGPARGRRSAALSRAMEAACQPRLAPTIRPGNRRSRWREWPEVRWL